MFDLDLSHTILLLVCLFFACGFEFVNGFHDTANAVATVIYTHSLKPWFAVTLSGIFNFLGVWLGGLGVAMGIVNLLPVESLVDQSVSHSLAMVLALLLSAISWNLLTWYFGIPCSSSHTLIGSILGVGLAFTALPEATGSAVNWSKATEIGISLLVSPLFGFSVTIVLMYILRRITKNKSYGEKLFKEPKPLTPPPFWIRSILILTCTSVSFSHGSNDGQKGVGLVMLILIGIVPGYFALKTTTTPAALAEPLNRIESIVSPLDASRLSITDRRKLENVLTISTSLEESLRSQASVSGIPTNHRFEIRKNIMLLSRDLSQVMKAEEVALSEIDRKQLLTDIATVRGAIDYAPRWVILMISTSLGIGTMIGWKRIVKTVGEKIGKEHLTYAQGASAEIVAASTIAVSTNLGLPVSTTHVLSSGIAGSMVATKGIKNLQASTVRNILLAWLLTLPVVMILSSSLFLIFRLLF